jgi:type IV secretory pathway VirB2 component (pilin)
MSVDASELRPLRVGEILDAGIKITTKRFAALAKIVAVVTIPIQVVSAFVTLSTTSEDAFSTSTSTTGEIDSEIWTQLAGNLVVSLLGLLATLVALAACTRIVAGAYFGEEGDWRESLAYAGRRLPSLLWLGLLYLVMVALGTLGCIIPGIWLAVAYAVSIPALLIEDERGTNALRRSFRLVRKRWWPTFGVLLLGFILINIVQTTLSLPLIGLLLVGGDDPNVVVFVVASTITGTIATVLTTPFLVAMLMVVYVDLRVRKEGLDLQLLAQRVGAPAPAPGSTPAWAATSRPVPGAAPPPGWSPPPPPPPGPPPGAPPSA